MQEEVIDHPFHGVGWIDIPIHQLQDVEGDLPSVP